MTNVDDGLSTPEQVKALADRLSLCADRLHARITLEAAAIAPLPDGTARTRRRATLETLVDAEQELRQRANGLYADAAAAIVTGLGTSQQTVLALADAAADKIRTIALLGDAIGLVGGLLALAAGVAGAHPAAAVAALETIRVQVAAIKTDRPPKRK